MVNPVIIYWVILETLFGIIVYYVLQQNKSISISTVKEPYLLQCGSIILQNFSYHWYLVKVSFSQ